MAVVAHTPNIILKNYKSNISLLSLFKYPAESEVSLDLNLRDLVVSLWSGSIGSTATRPAFWPGSASAHVVPQLHKRFSFPPDQLVPISDVPSVRQTHQSPFKRSHLWKRSH